MLGRDGQDGGVLKGLAVAEGTIRLETDPRFLAPLDGLLAVEERIDFDLVDA